MSLLKLSEDLSSFASVIEWKDDEGTFRHNILSSYQSTCLKKFNGYVESAACRKIARAEDLLEALNVMSPSERGEFSCLPYVVETVRFSEEKELTTEIASLVFLSLGYVLDTGRGKDNYSPSKVKGFPVGVEASGIPFLLNTTGITRWSEPSTEYANSEVEEVSKKIRNSLQFLKSESIIYRFVSDFTLVLGIRKNVSSGNKPYSGTFRGMVGFSAMTNPHLVEADQYYLADAMVHESMHTAMYMLEYINGCHIASDSDVRTNVSSPWTGSSLNVDNILQAAFVWYGLYYFWKELMNSKVDEGIALPYMERAFRGFEKLNLFMHRTGLFGRDEVCELVSQMASSLVEGRSWRNRFVL
ncbi:MAG: hypothetical protein ACI9SP_000864 [Arenicella sp.]|jgi:hypothetical protein